MKRVLCLSLLAVMAIFTVSAQRKQCIDGNWHFFYGDGSAARTNASVAGKWRTLTLPHDWSVENDAARQAGGTVIGPFSTNSVGRHQTGFTVGGEGWYQKTLNISPEDLDGRVVLYFEGVYYQSWVYVNGSQVNFCPYGYSSFRVDVTSKLKVGDNNIVVKVQNLGNNTRWYAGSGIYRHVWLIRTQKVYLDEWDTYISTTDNNNVNVSTIVHNQSGDEAAGSVVVKILDADGVEVQADNTDFTAVAANGNEEVNVNIPVNEAKTWSPNNPYLYTAVVSVKDKDGVVIDEFRKQFGFRTMSFSANRGFLLNGVRTLIKGGCVHHDNGVLGSAAFNKAEERKLKIIKAQGYNAVRCSHNLPSENFLDVCDKIGLMVVDECFDQWLFSKNGEDYHRYFATWSDRDVTDMVRRDRNHPSVIMWSIGNEIPGRIEPEGIAAAERLRQDILQYDTTRPVTAAICGWDSGNVWNNANGSWDAQSDNAFKSLDVGGYNYMFGVYEHDHSKYPKRVICGLESYPKQASENWNLVEKLPYVIGDFVWTAVDYIGEAGIGAALPDSEPPFFADWPWFNGNCGDIDLSGQKKPQSYYKDVVWREAPVTMAVQTTGSHNNGWGWQLEEQCWTYPGMEGQQVSVNVYSRAPKVRLYLNGVSQGDRQPGNTFWTGYNIRYQPGTLRVVNLNSSGKEVEGEEFVLTTTGEPTGIRYVYYDNDNILSDEENDLCFVTIELIDDEGRVVTADKQTQISVTNVGVGELIGCCTGSPNDMRSFRSTRPTVFRGRALAVVRSNGIAGEVKLDTKIVVKEPDPTDPFLKNASFQKESLEDWTITDGKYIGYKPDKWKGTDIDGYLECYVGWGNATSLRTQSISQSTKVLPAGKYTLEFDYNGTVFEGNNHYLTDGSMTGVIASVGGETLALTDIDAEQKQHASIEFNLEEPKAVSFLIKFASNTNADWFVLDNVRITPPSTFNFERDYIDYTSSVPEFGGDNWPRLSNNAAGGYLETKLGSEYYNGSGLAFWTSALPRNCDLFRQTISSLPEGRYGIAAFCAANRWSSSDNDRNHQPGTFLFAKTGSKQVDTELTSATYGLFSLVVDLNEGEDLTIGVRADTSNGNNWCYLSGITLVKFDQTDDPSAIELPQNSSPSHEGAQTGIYNLTGQLISNSQAVFKTLLPGIYIVNGKKIVKTTAN